MLSITAMASAAVAMPAGLVADTANSGSSFTFHSMEPAFPSLLTTPMRDRLLKWNLQPTMVAKAFRFDQGVALAAGPGRSRPPASPLRTDRAPAEHSDRAATDLRSTK